jgi:hypothetical protein
LCILITWLQDIPDGSIFEVLELDVPPSVEQVICSVAHDWSLIFDLFDLVIIEAVPLTVILGICGVVPTLQLPIVVRDAEEVIDQGFGISLPLTNHEVVHVQALDGEVHEGVLLWLHALEALEVQNQQGWGAEHLELFHCLLMQLAPRAKPGVLVWEALRGHELAEAVVNGHLIILVEVHGLAVGHSVRVDLLVLLGSDQDFIEGPALLGIEADLKLKLQVICLVLLLGCVGHKGSWASVRCGLLLVKLAWSCYKLLLLMVLIVKVWLGCNAMQVEVFPQSHFFERKRAVGALLSLAKYTPITVHSEILPSEYWYQVREVLKFLSRGVTWAEDGFVLLSQSHVVPEFGLDPLWNRYVLSLFEHLVGRIRESFLMIEV